MKPYKQTSTTATPAFPATLNYGDFAVNNAGRVAFGNKSNQPVAASDGGNADTVGGKHASDFGEKLTLARNGSTIQYVKIAEVVKDVGLTASGAVLTINGTSIINSSIPGQDRLCFGTRDGMQLLSQSLVQIRATLSILTYGYVDNTETGKVEIWIKRPAYHCKCSISIDQQEANTEVGILATQSAEPAGIVYTFNRAEWAESLKWYNTPDSVALTNNWYKMLDLSLTTQASEFTGTILINRIYSGSSTLQECELRFKFAQGGVMSSNPVVGLYYESVNGDHLSIDCFKAILENNTSGKKALGIYVKNKYANTIISYALQRIAWVGTVSYNIYHRSNWITEDALPTGTQYTCNDLSGYTKAEADAKFVSQNTPIAWTPKFKQDTNITYDTAKTKGYYYTVGNAITMTGMIAAKRTGSNANVVQLLNSPPLPSAFGDYGRYVSTIVKTKNVVYPTGTYNLCLCLSDISSGGNLLVFEFLFSTSTGSNEIASMETLFPLNSDVTLFFSLTYLI